MSDKACMQGNRIFHRLSLFHKPVTKACILEFNLTVSQNLLIFPLLSICVHQCQVLGQVGTFLTLAYHFVAKLI